MRTRHVHTCARARAEPRSGCPLPRPPDGRRAAARAPFPPSWPSARGARSGTRAARAAECRSGAPAPTGLSREAPGALGARERCGRSRLTGAPSRGHPGPPKKGWAKPRPQESCHVRFPSALRRLMKPTENTVANRSKQLPPANAAELGARCGRGARASGPGRPAAPRPLGSDRRRAHRAWAPTSSPRGAPPTSHFALGLCPDLRDCGKRIRGAWVLRTFRVFAGPRHPRGGLATGVCTAFLDASGS